MTEGTETQVEVVGINETLEVLEGLKILGVTAAGALKDGKINVADITYLVDLAKQFDVFKNAVNGADKIVAEAKNLDMAESTIIVAKVFEILSAIKAARA